MSSYPVDAAPHIRIATTNYQRRWAQALSLAAPLLAGLFIFRLQAIQLIGCSLAGAVLAEIAAKKIFRQRPVLQDGESIYTGFLIACLLPAALPPAAAALVSFLGVFLVKEMYGGSGENIFHPALAAWLLAISLGFFFLWSRVNFALFLSKEEFAIGSYFWNPRTQWLGGASPVLFLMSTLLSWGPFPRRELPFLFLILLGALGIATGLVLTPDMAVLLLLAAFHICSDTATTPIERSAHRWYVIGCAFLAIFFLGERQSIPGFFAGLLLMNALSPWFDAASRPIQNFLRHE